MKLLGKRLLVITAHPDDESFCAAGILRQQADAGAQILLICLTKGERGMSHVKRKTTAAALKKRRARELRVAARILGVRHVLHWDGGDGRVMERMAPLMVRTQKEAKRFQPDVAMSFGPDGITGHQDHVAAGRIGERIAKTHRIPFFAFALSPTLTQGNMQWLTSKRRATTYLPRMHYARPTHRIAIRGAIKRRALAAHRSQMDGAHVLSAYSKQAVAELLRAEYLVQRRPH